MIVNRWEHFFFFDEGSTMLCVVFERYYRHCVWFNFFYYICAWWEYINIWTRGAIAARCCLPKAKRRRSNVSRRVAMAIIIAVIVAVWKMNLSSHFSVWKYDFCQANVSAAENMFITYEKHLMRFMKRTYSNVYFHVDCEAFYFANILETRREQSKD